MKSSVIQITKQEYKITFAFVYISIFNYSNFEKMSGMETILSQELLIVAFISICVIIAIIGQEILEKQ